MRVLNLDSVKGLYADWPYPDLVRIEDILPQLDASLQNWPYVYMHMIATDPHKLDDSECEIIRGLFQEPHLR